jgi:metal-responsive CopG/Arc/MetJ family transcriptional regulator
MTARFNLVLSDEMNRQVDEVAADPETKSSVIRKALVMYLASVKAQKEQGLRVGLFDPKTREIKSEIIGL